MKPVVVYTTNYDRWLEPAFEHYQRPYSKITNVTDHVGAPVGQLDVNGLDPYRFEAATDSVLAGRPSRITVPAPGTLRFTGPFAKRGDTSDDVTVVVLKNGMPVLPAETISWDEIRTIDFNQDIVVNSGDEIALAVKTDSPIDLQQLSWLPRLVYVGMDGVAPGDLVDPATGEPQAAIKAWYDIDTYPVDALAGPSGAWKATKTGTLYVRPSLDVGLPA